MELQGFAYWSCILDVISGVILNQLTSKAVPDSFRRRQPQVWVT